MLFIGGAIVVNLVENIQFYEQKENMILIDEMDQIDII